MNLFENAWQTAGVNGNSIGGNMRTTLDLPDGLVERAMTITKAKTKTEVITIALENIIRQEKLNKLISFHGKVVFDVDLDSLRKR